MVSLQSRNHLTCMILTKKAYWIFNAVIFLFSVYNMSVRTPGMDYHPPPFFQKNIKQALIIGAGLAHTFNLLPTITFKENDDLSLENNNKCCLINFYETQLAKNQHCVNLIRTYLHLSVRKSDLTPLFTCRLRWYLYSYKFQPYFL